MELELHTIQTIISQQFPQYAHLEIRKVEKSGHDNRTFHLGYDFSLRFPSAIEYSTQVLKEHKYCKTLQKNLSFQITEPIELGNPSDLFPFNFSINRWIDGESINTLNVKDKNQLARDCARFLLELKQCDISEGPPPGSHNFYRGGNLSIYHDETIQAINQCVDFNQSQCLKIWDLGINSIQNNLNYWIHGDFEKDNLLIKNGKLYAVIDFGNMAVGDPACDYVMAWTYFDKESRKIFLDDLHLDQATINRAKAWALWKALITLNDLKRRNSALYTLNEILNDSTEVL